MSFKNEGAKKDAPTDRVVEASSITPNVNSNQPIPFVANNSLLQTQNKFQNFIDRGLLSELLPTIPPNAIINPHSNLDRKNVGKQPGSYNAQENNWMGLTGWNSFETTIEHLINWSDWPGDGVGIRTKKYPAIDIDVDDTDLANQINNIITLYMGNTATRSRTNSPRKVRLFKLADGEQPQRKSIIDLGKYGLIELLSDGQQVVVSGTHPSGGIQQLTGEIQEVTANELDQLRDILVNFLGDKVIKVTGGGDAYIDDKRGGDVAYVATDDATNEAARLYIKSRPGADAGERDSTCYKITAYVREYYGITSDKCAELMIEWGKTCNPKFPESEVRAKVKSAYGGNARAAQGEKNAAYIFEKAGIQPTPPTHQPVQNKAALWTKDQKLEWSNFPDKKINKNGEITGLKTTVKNLNYLLDAYEIVVNYDEIKHQTDIKAACFSNNEQSDEAFENNANEIISLCHFNGLSVSHVHEYIKLIGSKNSCNPVINYMEQLPKWDGRDHIKILAGGIQSYDTPVQTKTTWYLITLWLIQCIAAADASNHTTNSKARAKYESLLVLVGSQGITKTTWFNDLIPKILINYFKDGLFIDPNHKDSRITALTNWIVELGELDTTFKRSEISALKAFFSETRDQYRKSYARSDGYYKRRTSFCGSVNDFQFLKDTTGNRRYWPIHVFSIKPLSELNITTEQLWSQVYHLYLSGEQWWPTKEWDQYLDEYRNEFTDDEEESEIKLLLSERFKPFTEENKLIGSYMNATRIGQYLFPDEVKCRKSTLNKINHVLRKINFKSDGSFDQQKNTKAWRMPAKTYI